MVVADIVPEPIRASGTDGFGGVLGADLLLSGPIALDPRHELLWYGDGIADELTDVEDPIHVDLDRLGGGRTCIESGKCFDYEPNRLVIDVELDGISTRALIDTGATYVMVSANLHKQLLEAGGDQKTTLTLARGFDELEFQRIRELRVGAALVAGVPVAYSPELDAGLSRLRVETGEPIEVLLGHSFLMNFAAELDPREEAMRLYAYEDTSHTDYDRFDFIGLRVGSQRQPDGTTCHGVTMVAMEDSDVSRANAGDCLVSINGEDVRELSTRSVQDDLLDTQVNSSRIIGLISSENGRRYEVEAERRDRLPPYP